METLKINTGDNATHYSVIISNPEHKKLLAIQTKPDEKYWLKDKEVTIDKLVEVLQGIEI